MLSQVEEIKAKVDIVDLLQEYIKLTQAGANWKARCPFHNEKTPSFMVSRDKQIWHCFGCGEGGDVFTFIQKIEGLEFPEALRLMAAKAGVTLSRQDPAINNQRTRLMDINELAAKYFNYYLLKSQTAAAARDYLQRRGVDALTIDSWLLGLAPDSWDETGKFLQSRGFTETEIFLAGLIVKKDPSIRGASRGVGFYDRFRGRLTIPIRDTHGHVVGFSARTLIADAKEAKYVNTPQTMIFNKGQLLFGLDRAKDEIRREKLAVLVEGNLDVVASYQFGVNKVVASCGTALTAEQLTLLKRYTENLILCFDPDLAGQTAAERGIGAALRQGFNVRLLVLPTGEDPDNFIRHHGADAWREKIASAVQVMEYYFDKNFTNANLADPRVKKTIVAKLLPVLADMAEPVEQAHWLQQLAERLSVPETILRETMVKLTKKAVAGEAPRALAAGNTWSRDEKISQRLLALLRRFPENLVAVERQLAPEAVIGDKENRLYTELLIYYNRARTETPEISLADIVAKFSQNFDQELVLYLEKLALSLDQSGGLTVDQAKEEVIKIIRELKKLYLNSQLKGLGERIKRAESAGQDAESKQLAERFSELASQLYNLG